MTDHADFIADAKAKNDAWRESRRAYVAELSKHHPGIRPWPLRRQSVWRVKPAPGTIDAAEDEVAIGDHKA